MSETQSDLLTVNNIEVIYDHVILVLKGVSLTVPEGAIVALLAGSEILSGYESLAENLATVLS